MTAAVRPISILQPSGIEKSDSVLVFEYYDHEQSSTIVFFTFRSDVECTHTAHGCRVATEAGNKKHNHWSGPYETGRARQCMMKCSGFCETPWIRLRNEGQNVTSNARCKIRLFSRISVLLTPVGSTCWQYLLAVPVVSVLLISILLTALWNRKVGFRSGV